MWNQVIRGTIFFQNANHDSKYFDEFSEWDKDNSQTLQQMVGGGKDKLGFLRQVKKQNKQNKAHLNKKEKQKERKRERKKRDLGTSEVWGCLHGNYWTSYRKPQKAQQPTVPKWKTQKTQRDHAAGMQ